MMCMHAYLKVIGMYLHCTSAIGHGQEWRSAHMHMHMQLGGAGGLEHKVQDSRSSDYGMSKDQAQAMAANVQW